MEVNLLMWLNVAVTSAVTVFFLIKHLKSCTNKPPGGAVQPKNALGLPARGLIFLLSSLAIVSIPLLLPNPWPSTAQEAILDVGQDEAGSLTIDEAMQLPAERWRHPSIGDLNTVAITPKVFWLKVAIKSRGTVQNLVAQIAYTFIHQSTFYLMEGNHVVDSAEFAMSRSALDGSSSGIYPTFPLSASADRDRTLFVRIKSEGHVLLRLTLRPASEAALYTNLRSVLSGIFLGFVIGAICFKVLVSFRMREPLYGFNAVFEALIVVALLLYDGILLPFLPQLCEFKWITLALNETLLLIFFAFVVLYHEFFALGNNFVHASRMIKTALLCTGFCMVLAPFTGVGHVVTCILAAYGVYSVVLALGCISLLHYEHVFYFVLGLSGLLCGMAANFLGMLGVLPPCLGLDYIAYVGVIWYSLLFSLAMRRKYRIMESERNTIIEVLERKAPIEKLNQILGRSFEKSYSPSEMEATIMFIDLVGYSEISKAMGSDRVYAALASRMREFSTIVHECNGSVDRSLGDGMLCFFGYKTSLFGASPAESAFTAARRIQETTLTFHFFDDNHKKVVMPVRIGLNIGTVTVGNLGGAGRVDFTMIGNGVNFASRLEAACNPFMIMVSEEFKNSLGALAANLPGFNEIHISIKHREELIRAYEFNPFLDRAEQLARTEKDYYACLGYARQHDRQGVERCHEKVLLTTKYGTFGLTDFSIHGFGMVGDTFVGRKSVMSIGLLFSDPKVTAQVENMMLKTIDCEVRWCRCIDGRYSHGMKMVGLNSRQKMYLYEKFQEFFGRLQNAA